MKNVLALTWMTLISSTAYALPVGSFDALKTKPRNIESLAQEYDFNGIVKLSNCSGSIVRLAGAPDTAPAIAMTNGHCLGGNYKGMLAPGEVVVGRPISRSMRVYNKNTGLVPVKATKVLYATMTKTDLTLFELKETYGELEAKGVDSFDLDGMRPMIGVSIDVVSGYWDRGYRCNIDGFVFQLRESDWTMSDSIRYSNLGCNTIGGTSGSPIIQTGTRIVIGINNTGNESGEKCTMNNPCEVDERGQVTVKEKASYGQQTFNVYSCLTPDFRIDLTLPNCSLQKPKTI